MRPPQIFDSQCPEQWNSHFSRISFALQRMQPEQTFQKVKRLQTILPEMLHVQAIWEFDCLGSKWAFNANILIQSYTYLENCIHMFFLNFAFIRYVIAFLKINILVIESAEWTVSSCKYVVGNFSKKLVVVSAFRDIAKYINIDPNQIAYP